MSFASCANQAEHVLEVDVVELAGAAVGEWQMSDRAALRRSGRWILVVGFSPTTLSTYQPDATRPKKKRPDRHSPLTSTSTRYSSSSSTQTPNTRRPR